MMMTFLDAHFNVFLTFSYKSPVKNYKKQSQKKSINFTINFDHRNRIEMDKFVLIFRIENNSIFSFKITLEFYQKKKSRWVFKPEEIPWEIWTIKIEQMPLSSENERQFMREKLSDTLTERIFQITEIM